MSRLLDAVKEGSSSRYAEPEADGVKPVFKTVSVAKLSTHTQDSPDKTLTYFSELMGTPCTLRRDKSLVDRCRNKDG